MADVTHPVAQGSRAHDRLVEDLVGRLTPVRRLPAPGLRAAGWFVAIVLIGTVLAAYADLASLRQRMLVPDLFLAVLGSVLTALAAVFAAFQTSVPGRSRAWAFLPLAPAALWIGASGAGCLREWFAPGANIPGAEDVGGCLAFILGLSLPLSLALILMLRRACPLRPNLTAALGGLAAAAAAASLLVLIHPHDATAVDLIVHLVVVGLVIVANAFLGGRLLGSPQR